VSPSVSQGLQRLVITPEQVHQQRLQLLPKQSHYLYRVLRLQAGQRFIALMHGEWWLTELAAEPYAQLLEPIPIQTELPVAVSLMAALPKGNGFDDVVTQATELGVRQIQPLLSERTLLNPSANRLERWQRLAQEAAEQSLRQVVPQILPPLPLDTGLKHWIADSNLVSNREHWKMAHYICVLDAAVPHLSQALHQTPPNHAINLLTGPEAGWTATEQSLAISLGFQPVTLGARTLRAVTAPLAALTIVAAYLEGYRQCDLVTVTEPL
jgi:16S rRNA (uracil1498-N3)-methyltransferase